ncbi:uncharacterized protein LOC143955433 [Lithobates pipiens]
MGCAANSSPVAALLLTQPFSGTTPLCAFVPFLEGLGHSCSQGESLAIQEKLWDHTDPNLGCTRWYNSPSHTVGGNLEDNNIVVKEEYKEEDEEYGVMEEFSEGHKDMMEPPNTRNPPERCPRPLYSRDSTQEDHTIPHHHQSGNLRDPKVEVKEEIKEEDDEDGVMEESLKGHHNLYQDTMEESSRYRNPPERCPRGNLGDDNIDVKEEYKEEDEEYGVMEEFSEGHKDMMEPPNTRNPPERCPRPLYSRDSTPEDLTIPHCYKSGDPMDIEFEVKSEEEERYVRDDQQSMEEDGITGTFIEEDTPTEISTGGSLTLNPFLHPYCSLIGPE